MTRLLLSILFERRYLIAAAVAFLVFVALYLAATQFLIFSQSLDESGGFFTVKIAENWREIMFQQRAPFLFESIGAVYVGRLKLFISIPNLFLASLLGALVALNLAVSYYSFKALALKGAKGFSSLLATVPAIVSGAACCVPTLIIVIGLQMTGALIAVWPFLVPLSFLLLFGALWWSLHKIKVKRL